MSDDLDTGSQPDIETQARNLGWQPQDEFKGDPSKWTDAETFVEKGKHIIPILKKNNERLQRELAARDGALSQLNSRLKDSEDAIQALKEFHDESAKKAVADAKKGLLAQLKQAKSDQDVDAEVAITDELTRINAAERDAKEKPAAKGANGSGSGDEVDYTQTTWWKSWAAENPWFGKDARRTALSTGIIQELLQDPETSHLRGKPLLDRVSEEVEKTFGSPRTRTDRVEGARTGGGGNGGAEAKSFASLPKEARETCDRQATRMVGDGRAFKTKADWQAYYAKEYFRGEG